MLKDRSPRRRPEPRQAKKPRGQRTVRWRFFLAVLPIAFAAGLTYAVLQASWFTVQQVNVAGAQTLDTTDLATLSGLEGKSLFRLPADQARAALLEIPQIKSVAIERNWPQGVTIKVEERQPAAFWSLNGRDFVVDDDGVVLAAGAPSGPAPRIVEVNATGRSMGPGDRVQPDAIALAERIFQESPRFLGQDVRELEYEPAIGVTAVFNNGLRVTFGDERSYDYKVAVLAKLLDQLTARGTPPHAVDLRFGERVTYE